MSLRASDNDEAWNLNMTNIVTQRERIKCYLFEEKKNMFWDIWWYIECFKNSGMYKQFLNGKPYM